MKLLKQERGISLVEVVASIVLITIVLVSFSTVFLQSKKTHVLSDSIVDATYTAQQEMEGIYGFISGQSNSFDTLSTIELPSLNEKFTYKSDCGTNCKQFVFTYTDKNGDTKFNEHHWIQLQKNTVYPTNLVNVVVNVPKENSSTPVMMESIFRWGN